MDLLTISPADVAGMNLKHPVTGEDVVGSDGLPVVFQIAGADSPQFRNASRAVANARINRKKGETVTAESVEADGLSVIAACVTGWSCNFSIGGVASVWSPERARNMLNEQPWVKEQVDRFVGSRANFLPKG